MDTQVKELINILSQNKVLMDIIKKVPDLKMKDWYIESVVKLFLENEELMKELFKKQMN